LPSSAWSAAPLGKNAHAVGLGFQRAPIEDSEGRQVVPFIAIIVEKLAESPDIVAYTLAKRMAVPLHVDRVFIWQNEPRLKLKNAMCYEGNISCTESRASSVSRSSRTRPTACTPPCSRSSGRCSGLCPSTRRAAPKSAEQSALRAICSDPASQR
jgi:hypothetical protein